ncbi:MAG: nucleotidyltransferase family protein [Erysipelotrichaceae bacterium]|nr:nucleotidyltransferase family protein [Erysipelotrichaceae bacterium]
MKASGIVAEYNPFHYGHKYHIEQARLLTGADVMIAAMSGNFVQRGEPAIIDKWQRTECALNNGSDIVFEIPFAFVCQAASQYGSHGIDILAKAGVSSVVFGSETGNLEELQEIASLSFNVDNFRENMKKGYSYPASYGYMADSYGPNDILAISYLKALQNYPGITPYCVKRTNEYNDLQLSGQHASARAIREALLRHDDVSSYTPMAAQLLESPQVRLADYYQMIRSRLLTCTPAELRDIFLVDEGIENLMIKNAYDCYDFDSFMDKCITKRYTRSRIQRTLCQILVNNKRETMRKLPKYDIIRVLGFNEKGQQYLKQLQENGVRIANHYTANIKPYRDLEYRAAVIYGALMDEEHQHYINRSEISGLNL